MVFEFLKKLFGGSPSPSQNNSGHSGGGGGGRDGGGGGGGGSSSRGQRGADGNGGKPKTIDLHGHNRDSWKTPLKTGIKEASRGETVKVVTGRGKHSAGGKPVIKPRVEKYLDGKKYKPVWSKDGGSATFKKK